MPHAIISVNWLWRSDEAAANIWNAMHFIFLLLYLTSSSNDEHLASGLCCLKRSCIAEDNLFLVEIVDDDNACITFPTPSRGIAIKMVKENEMSGLVVCTASSLQVMLRVLISRASRPFSIPFLSISFGANTCIENLRKTKWAQAMRTEGQCVRPDRLRMQSKHIYRPRVVCVYIYRRVSIVGTSIQCMSRRTVLAAWSIGTNFRQNTDIYVEKIRIFCCW